MSEFKYKKYIVEDYIRGDEQELPNVTEFKKIDELLGFIGIDWENPDSLSAEVEFWLEDEKYILTKSFVTFVLKGLNHCPLKMLTSERPVFHLGVSPENRVTKLTRK